ncbi:fibro-slime domain-containing protein [uncultured Dubosiella sp.]|uniref:fibro-slime domain-containing protein n=1 Tax=uncultured Dubosiella sp. TaxID=1937011 RepID=UPI0025B467F5|nr:fibro-slime domain-containing protein [uncultured Dubosiella sp.]
MKGNKIGKRVWHRCVTALSCLVVFCTTYALILPAVALEHDKTTFYCEKEEHQHTDECNHSKDPLCGQEESETKPGHTHGDECYEIRVVENQICGLEENENHQHNEQCFETIEEKNLICTQEEAPEEKGHSHSANCYLSVDPVCGKEEHTHSRECESNKALKETKDEWENSIPKKLDEDLSKRIVQVADSQLKYKEVLENFEIVDGVEKGYTRYGEWYGRPYEDWNIMFASFVLKYAGVSNEKIPYGHDWNEWIEDLMKRELFEPEDYEAQNGDLVFFRDQEDENDPDKKIQSYVGIVKDHNKNKAIVGDFEDEVREVIVSEEDYKVLAYVHPKEEQVDVEKPEQQPVQPDEENPNPEEEPKPDGEEQEPQEIEYRLPEEFTAETEDFTLVLKPRKIAGVETEVDETTENEEKPVDENDGLAMKNYVLPTEENMQDKLDEEQNMTVEELDQIQEDNLQQKEEEENKPVPTLVVEKMDETNIPQEDQEGVAQLKEQSLEEVDPEQLLDLSLYKLRFFVGEQEVNLEDQKFDAELTPTPEYILKDALKLDYSNAVEEIEEGVEVRVHNTQENQLENQDLFLEDQTKNSAEFYSFEKKTEYSIEFEIKNKELVCLSKTEPGNHKFTVQYYGYIYEYEKAQDNEIKKAFNNKENAVLPVIKMDKSNFPTAFNSASFQFYKLTNGTSGSIKTKKKENPETLYREKIYEYHKAPNLMYFNRLANEASYELTKFWILKDGKNKDSTNESDWDIYEPGSVYLTNKESLKNQIVQFGPNKGKKYIYVEDGKTVIRLIYDEKFETNLEAEANFYDYDITNAGTNNASLKIYPTQDSNGNPYGINQNKNYQNNGDPKLAFGNTNTGVSSRYEEMYNNYYYLNRAALLNIPAYPYPSNKLGVRNQLVVPIDSNMKKYMSEEAAPPIFGMVSRTIDQSTYNLQYNGIDAPNLFNVGKANGKTSYTNEPITFKRRGNTYTLTSTEVQGYKNAKPLDILYHPTSGTRTYGHIWTNNFWPMDGVNNTDPHTGDGSHKYKTDKPYPVSDDQNETHNNMFGMFYQVEFELDEDYLGPLEYFFFGDDDLWVYLDNQLIADLGGVHSSYGAYVDIRQYLPKSQNNDSGNNGESKKKKHTLTVFYTERGLSGSTCYMEFNLPSVTSVEQPQETGTLRVHKETEDNDYSTPYKFKITLYGDEAGMRDFVYTKYTIDQNKEEGLIKHDPATFTSTQIIELRKNEYFEISYLPPGTHYVVEELDINGSTKVYTGSAPESYEEAKYVDAIPTVDSRNNNKYQSIAAGNVRDVYFKNVRFFKLPETGGFGINPPLIASGAGLMTTSVYVIGIQKKKRRKK